MSTPSCAFIHKSQPLFSIETLHEHLIHPLLFKFWPKYKKKQTWHFLHSFMLLFQSYTILLPM